MRPNYVFLDFSTNADTDVLSWWLSEKLIHVHVIKRSFFFYIASSFLRLFFLRLTFYKFLRPNSFSLIFQRTLTLMFSVGDYLRSLFMSLIFQRTLTLMFSVSDYLRSLFMSLIFQTNADSDVLSWWISEKINFL